MKHKISLSIFLSLIILFNVCAQKKGDKAVTKTKEALGNDAGFPTGYHKGTFLLNLGITGGGASYYGSIGFPAVSINGEVSLNEKVSLGGYLGYYGGSYGYGAFGYGYDDHYHTIAYGVKATYHATGLFNKLFNWSLDPKLDLFGSAYLGFRTQSWTYDNTYNNGNPHYGHPYVNTTVFTGGPTVGGRYFFTPKFAGYVELGYNGIGVASIGLSFRPN